MDTQEIILKCQKLSRLSTSNNPNEAALAASRLAEIMIKYQISDIDLNDKSQLESNKVDSHLFYSSKRKSHWRMNIASGCARLFNCIPYWTQGTGVIHLIGREDDVNLCKYLYESITQQIDSLCSSEWNAYWLETCLLDDSEDDQEDSQEDTCTCNSGYDPECPWRGHNRPYTPLSDSLEHKRSWSQSFLLSCSSVVRSRLLEKHRFIMSSLPSNSTALIVFKDRYKDSLKYAKSMSWSKKKSEPTSSSIHGMISGQVSGIKVRIDKELTHNLPLLKR